MDALSFTIFLVITIFFAMLLTFLLKFTVLRYFPWAMQIPWWMWVVVIVLLLFALQGMGVPVSAGYSAFFKWLSGVLGGEIEW